MEIVFRLEYKICNGFSGFQRLNITLKKSEPSIKVNKVTIEAVSLSSAIHKKFNSVCFSLILMIFGGSTRYWNLFQVLYINK